MTVELLNGDCLEKMDNLIARGMAVDLTVTSPPYDNLRTYNDTLNWSEKIWKQVLDRLYNITKKGGVVVWVVGDATIKGSESGTSFRQALYAKEIGFNLHDTMIYSKINPVPLTHNRYEQQFEYMFVFSKEKPKTFNPITQDCKTYGNNCNHKREKAYDKTHSMRRRDATVTTKKTKFLYNIWNVKTGTSDKVDHSAPFPLKLARDHIISWSNKGDTVLDCFMGSGTTGVACHNTDRNFIGIELDDNYFRIASNRIYENSRQQKLF